MSCTLKKELKVIVTNNLENESKLNPELSNNKSVLKNTFCAEVNCTNKYTRQVMVRNKNSDFTDNEVFQIPLCKHHYENFHSQIELENDVKVIPTGFDQN